MAEIFAPFEPNLTSEERREVAAAAFGHMLRYDVIHPPLSLEFEGCVYVLSKKRAGRVFEVTISQDGCPDIVHELDDGYNRVNLTVYRGRVCVLGYWLWIVRREKIVHSNCLNNPIISTASNPPTIISFSWMNATRWGDWNGDNLRWEYTGKTSISIRVCSIIVDSRDRLVVLEPSRILWLTPDFKQIHELQLALNAVEPRHALAEVEGRVCLIRREPGKDDVFLTHPTFDVFFLTLPTVGDDVE